MKTTDVKFIVLHCSATRCNTSYPAYQLDQDHRARGFDGAGYHFYVRRSGEIIPMRDLHRIGAHTLGYNRCSIGVCYEGGLSASGRAEDTRTPEQKRSLRLLMRTLRSFYPSAKILGHRDLSPDRNGNGRVEREEWLKACPCFDAILEYQYI